MRLKIIIVNAGIVAIVGLLSYFLLSTALGDVVSNPAAAKENAERSLRAANARLALDALQAEHWLSAQSRDAETVKVFGGGTAQARSDAATTRANKIRDAAVGEAMFAKMAPSLILFIDKQGVAIGRNGSALMRGDKILEGHPALKPVLENGTSASDLWLGKQKILASYAPVRGEDGAVIGAIVMGSPLNDERLSRTSDLSSGRGLILSSKSGEKVDALANSGEVDQSVTAAAAADGAQKAAAAALSSGNITTAEGSGVLLAVAPLEGYGDGKQAVLIAGVPASLVPSVSGLLWPVFAVAGLGILLVVVGGMLLGNYISQPVSEIEEGLLQVINGNANYRFELEHPELGGIAHRLNTLLNAMMGVPETDEDGRPSAPPAEGEYPA